MKIPHRNLAGMIGLMILFLPGMSLAARIETTFGKVFEGDVIEERDSYLRIRTAEGDTYKIRQRHIASRSDESQAAAATEDLSPAEQWDTDRTLADWERWQAENENYLKQVERLQGMFMSAITKASAQINRYLSSGKIREGLHLGRTIGNQVQDLEQRLTNVIPPEELKNYHEIILESFRHQKKAMDAWLLGDQQVYYREHRRSLRSFINGVEELGRVQHQMGAPGFMSTTLERMVEAFRKELEGHFH